ncbi:hypothetical protein SI65_07003 [Aspergillus cristatus]|uniref:Uncharacterized protein n=1 Tax=Aspergillus cristatus TaxID=573508 RepID=A0A1E3B8X1_ASPCR|nr:hypothetical protein SI65_07003 [Aspergillus cristatus]
MAKWILDHSEMSWFELIEIIFAGRAAFDRKVWIPGDEDIRWQQYHLDQYISHYGYYPRRMPSNSHSRDDSSDAAKLNLGPGWYNQYMVVRIHYWRAQLRES